VYNDTWTLCITEADVASLSPARAAASGIALQTIARSLAAVDRRVRLSEEETYYRNQVWYAARKEAAKKIADKQRQRDMLLYQGNKAWKYDKELKKIDGELVTLREALAKVEAEEPLIVRDPRFALFADNLSYRFPAPPKPGREHSFCKEKKIDGFLSSELTEFHERLILDVKLYSLSARSYTYEDSVIFSTESIDDALMELSERVIEHVSQSPPAGIVITAEPDNALITVNQRFAGRGASDLIERNPGPVTIEVFADEHGSYTDTVELLPKELTELSVRLPPLPIAGITVNTGEPAALYRGALYIGETPFNLSAPLDSRIPLMVETADKKSASTAVLIDNSALTIIPVKPPEENVVDKARRGFYGAWGRFWIALPLALVVNGMYSSYLSAYNMAPARTEDDFNTARTYQYAAMGAGILAGGFGVEFAVRLVYYVIVSNKERSPLVPPAPPEPVAEEAPVTEDTPVAAEEPMSEEEPVAGQTPDEAAAGEEEDS
jgi:hypothetical protein